MTKYIDLKLLKFIEKEGDFYKGNYKGFDFLIIRPHYYYKHGNNFLHLCGYVIIDKSSKYYIDDYCDSYDFIKCHGELSYCKSDVSYNDFQIKNSISIGFGCMNEDDLSSACTLFAHRNASYKDMYFVKRECKSIINQLIQHTDK